MPDALPLITSRQLHLQTSLGILHQQRERAIIAMFSASRHALVHISRFDMCFIIVIFYIKRTELALVEAHLLMTIFWRTFCEVFGFFIFNHQWRIIKQSINNEMYVKKELKHRICALYRNVVSFSFSPSNMCECFSTKKFSGISTATASAWSKRPVRFLKSFANSAMCSRNPGSGWEKRNSESIVVN